MTKKRMRTAVQDEGCGCKPVCTDRRVAARTVYHESWYFAPQFWEVTPSQLGYNGMWVASLCDEERVRGLEEEEEEEEDIWIPSVHMFNENLELEGRSIPDFRLEAWIPQLAAEDTNSNPERCYSYHSPGCDASQEAFQRERYSSPEIHLTESTSHATDNFCGDDSQEDISCYLQNWDDLDTEDLSHSSNQLFKQDGDPLLSPAANLPETDSRSRADLRNTAQSDCASGEPRRCRNEACDQDWMAMAEAACLDRMTDSESEAFMVHLLEV